jgi:hypothetical protein
MRRALLLAALALAPGGAAGLAPGLAAAAGAPEGIALSAPGRQVTLPESALASLPSVHLDIAFETEHGPRKAGFDGPLLWTVLVHAGAVDPSKPREQPRQAVLVTGSDGYSAVLALGELSPEFANKPVILAESMDGKPLGPDHLRIVVPGDVRGGRSVRDVARIAVVTPAAP